MPIKKICQKEGTIATLETNIKNIMQDLDQIKNDIKEFRTILNEYITKSEKQKQEIISWILEHNNKNYAHKWVEKILIFIGGLVGTAVIGAIMSIIIIK